MLDVTKFEVGSLYQRSDSDLDGAGRGTNGSMHGTFIVAFSNYSAHGLKLIFNYQIRGDELFVDRRGGVVN